MTATGSSTKLPSRREDAVEIIRRLRAAGHVAYLAGGCVRDELLGLIPKDFDVATDAPPGRVREIFPKAQGVGAAFGVMLVRAGVSMIEVATFRTDSTYTDGRRPDSVEFTDAQHDALRRDFTINGLFFDAIEQKVIDFVGGQDDLRAKRLRAIGDPQLRFGEDYLRLLRAVRFAARFDLTIEQATREAIVNYASRLTQISPERICEELRMMLTAPTRAKSYAVLREFGLLDVVTRFISSTPSAVRTDSSRDDSTLAQLNSNEVVSYELALAALAHDKLRADAPNSPQHQLFTKDSIARSVRGLRKALRISNDETESLHTILSFGQLLEPSVPPSVAKLKRHLALPASQDARHFLAAIAKTDTAAAPIIANLEKQFAQFEKTDYAPSPLLTGDHLVAAGWQPSPLFKRVLDQVYDQQLEGRIATHEEGMELANQIASTTVKKNE